MIPAREISKWAPGGRMCAIWGRMGIWMGVCGIYKECRFEL